MKHLFLSNRSIAYDNTKCKLINHIIFLFILAGKKVIIYNILRVISESELSNMSQEKVDRRKEQKKNRKQIIAKEKRRSRINKLIGYLCLLCIIGGVGFSVYYKMNPTPEPDATAFYSLISTDSYGILNPSLPESE